MELDNVVAFLAGKAAAGGGGGGDITVEPLSVTENGTTTAPSGKAYSPVTVNVPNSYSAGDEGKVVSNGALVAQTSDTVTANDTYDTTLINSLTVNVSGVNWDGFAAGTWPSGEAVLSNSVTDIASYAFNHDGGITSISGPEVLTINEYNMSNCSALTSVYLPKVTRIGLPTAKNSAGSVFTQCYALRTLHLPELLEANGGSNLSSLGETNGAITIVLPKITAIGGSNLRDLKAEAVDIGPNLATLTGYNFYSSYGYYNNIILRKTDGVVDAPASNCISGIRATTKVWVPSALIDSYKAASNWSTLGDVFYAIEGSIYEHAYADGTPIPTT